MSLTSICCFKSCFEGTGFLLKPVPVKVEERISLDECHKGRSIGYFYKMVCLNNIHFILFFNYE